MCSNTKLVLFIVETIIIKDKRICICSNVLEKKLPPATCCVVMLMNLMKVSILGLIVEKYWEHFHALVDFTLFLVDVWLHISFYLVWATL